MTHKILDHDTQKIIYRNAVRPKKSSTPTIGLHHMEGRFLHLLTLLKIKFPLDHHLNHKKDPHRNRRPLQTSSGTGMKRIHLDRSLCLPLTPVTYMVEHSYFQLRRMGRGIVPRLPDNIEIIDQEIGQNIENINFILDIGNGKVEELISYNQLLEHIQNDRIPSSNPGSVPPRDARDSGSVRSHSMHLETSSSDRP